MTKKIMIIVLVNLLPLFALGVIVCGKTVPPEEKIHGLLKARQDQDNADVPQILYELQQLPVENHEPPAPSLPSFSPPSSAGRLTMSAENLERTTRDDEHVSSRARGSRPHST